jgi:hypothetical protein
MADPAQVSVGGAPCGLCAQTEIAEWCSGPDVHTADVQELAWTCARYVHGDDATAEQARWFLDDAEAMSGTVHGPHFYISAGGGREVALTNVNDYFEVNGVTFWLDPNGEMGTVPTPASLCPTCGQCYPDDDDLAIHLDEEPTHAT